MNIMANITYRKVNGYLIPNLTLPPEESTIRLGKWGLMHKEYLLNHKKTLFATLFSQGKLWQYLADIDTQAQQMFDTLVEQMKEDEGITEQLKEENQMKWICCISSIQTRANEIICKELIFD